MREIFNSIDNTGNGYITKDQMVTFFNSLIENIESEKRLLSSTGSYSKRMSAQLLSKNTFSTDSVSIDSNSDYLQKEKA